jgi:NADPH:quinone reductase-like Zn-dependent oxidoreductase
VWTRYGPPEGLQLGELPKPTPKGREVLVKIHATAIAAGDCELRALRFSLGLRIVVRMLMGIRRPRRKVLGQELAGEVEEVGAKVTRFRRGDQVFGTTGFGFGAYAEYICLVERGRSGALAMKPVNMTYEEAAAVPTGGLEARHFLRRAGTLNGRSVVINGAGGGIGMYAVQLAKHFGARVTAVDSAEKLDMLRALGADRVVDFAREDFTRMGEKYDVIFDVVGRSALSDCLAALHPGGRCLLGNPRLSAMVRGRWVSATGSKKVIFGPSEQRSEDLEFLRRLIEAGKLRTVIDRRLPLERVPEAHRYFDTGLALGRVVITLDGVGADRAPAILGEAGPETG